MSLNVGGHSTSRPCLVLSTGLEPAFPTVKGWWLDPFAYDSVLVESQAGLEPARTSFADGRLDRLGDWL